MSKDNTTNQNQTQNSQTNPWAPSQPLLNSILGNLGQQNTAVTPAQQAAAGQLQTAASGLPNFAPSATNAANTMLSGGNATQYAPMLSNAWGQTSGALSPYLSAGYTDPSTNPAIRGLINTTNQDVTNQINGQFAAAGRDLSPANTTALARGLSQGESGILANQYNTNVGTQLGAANQYLGGAGQTAQGLLGMNQTGMQNMLAGGQFAGMIPGLSMAPGAMQLQAANTAYGQPYQNIQSLLGLTAPIAALGGQSTGSSNQNTTQQQSPLSTILGGAIGGAGALGSLFSTPGGVGGASAASGIGSALGSLGALFSDERVKEDIKPVGLLFDGSPLYSYRYIPEIDPTGTPRIGLMAQDVEKRTPEAVKEIGGVKAVDYDAATKQSQIIGGLLSGLKLAA